MLVAQLAIPNRFSNFVADTLRLNLLRHSVSPARKEEPVPRALPFPSHRPVPQERAIMVLFPFANCGLCRPQRQAGSGGSAPAAVAPPGTPLGGPTQPASVPQMLRSKSEARILRVDAGSVEAAAMLRSQSMPSSTLLEASRRRLAAAEAAAAAAAAAQQMEEDGAAAKEFVHLYMKAIKDGNPRWVGRLAGAHGRRFTRKGVCCMPGRLPARLLYTRNFPLFQT